MVVRRLEIIGESVKNLSEEVTIKHAGIPWRQIAGLRDKVIHHYFGVDYRLIWNTVNKDIPILKDVVKKLIKER